MPSGLARAAARVVRHRSTALTVLDAAAGDVRPLLDEVTDGVGPDCVRYWFSGGAGRFTRPVWGFGYHRPDPEPPTDLSITLSMVRCREEREAAVARELRSVTAWLDAADGAPRTLVLEVRGTPSQEDVAFWQACRLRLARHADGRQSMVVVRHAGESPEAVTPSGRTVHELSIALHLAGDHVFAPELAQWQHARGWDADMVTATTEPRQTHCGTMHTYASTVQNGHLAADVGLVAELAALVAAQPVPSLAVAALVTDPVTALAAFSGHGCAEAAYTPRGLSRYAGTLHRRARATDWAVVPRPITAAAYLAAMTAERGQAVSAPALLSAAESHEVGARARGVLAYALGQQLVRTADTRPAGLRMFEYARQCQDTGAANPQARGSQLAASFNGGALAHYRGGDLVTAVAAMRAGLDALGEPGIVDRGHLHAQQAQLLTNLAKVHRRQQSTRPDALAEYRAAWQAALTDGSVSALSYVAADLAAMLAEDGEIGEAETVVRELLRRYDLAREPVRTDERAVVAACCHLADAHLAADAAQAAATWYLAAAQRMRRGGPEVIDAIIQNLHNQPVPGLRAELARERNAQRLLTDDVTALRGLAEATS